MVTGSPSDTAVGGGVSRLPAASRYGAKFEELCGYYMSLGMSFHDYWDGDSTMTRYYRESSDFKLEQKNMSLWLLGFYIYEAVLDASPVLNSMSKRKKPFPYRESPIPLTKRAKEGAKTDAGRKSLESIKGMMQARMNAWNQKFKRKEGEKHVHRDGGS